MPTAGFSLVGFLDEQAAFHHLRFVCMPADPADAALRAVWQAAQAHLGAPTPNAGNPGIHPVPQAQEAYVDQVRRTPWVDNALKTILAGAEFRIVDIAPLLAFQQTVDLARCAHHCGQANNSPTMDDIFRICLPMALETVTPQVLQAPGSLMLKARSGNLRITGWGGFTDKNGANVVGIALGIAPTLVHVVRYDGRYYLHNGYHRTVALMRAGATQIACLVRDVVSPQDVGIRDDGGTFKLPQLVGPNPPTVAHFADGRPCAVSLRTTSRIIHVSWSEYMAPED